MADDRGRIWVQRKRPGASGRDDMYGPPGGAWNVFAPDGAYLGSVEPPDDAVVDPGRRADESPAEVTVLNRNKRSRRS